MKIKIRHHDDSIPQEDSWSQMGDWLAELGDDSHTEPPGDAHAEAGGTDDPWPEAFARADARAQANARARDDARTQADARAEADARTQADARAEAHGETSVTPTAVMATYLEPRPVQNTTTSDPAPARPATATQHNQPRPLEVAECSLCGIALPLGLLVPDGGQACADIRWYCKDAMSCAHRWTTASPPASAHMPAAPDDTSRDADKAAPDKTTAELLDDMSEAASSPT
jgi:hypothetical protein